MSRVQDSFCFAETESGTEVFELQQAQWKKLKRGYIRDCVCVYVCVIVCVSKTSGKDTN